MANKFIRIVGWFHFVSFRFVHFGAGAQFYQKAHSAMSCARVASSLAPFRAHSVTVAAIGRMHTAHSTQLASHPERTYCPLEIVVISSRSNACYLCMCSNVAQATKYPAGVKMLHTRANRWRWQWQWQWPAIRCTMRKVIMWTTTARRRRRHR